ncbi:MAG: signal peptidase I [Alphaproteobacteria bacterium]|nr:signal peptidase I [Alphaproteobacteria bacterium]MBU1525716.1 signal peptidase I [Alphaproteobacteria bacterium]MBU2117605.1 signal peptidase I [Alphaproteobacteria bacterium]MBU2351903.1 signal peptidase I [Alphaproteobacteria bacterium]MBU2382757.1 signal peptidase I [Alphaproteobacteria bacterium]
MTEADKPHDAHDEPGHEPHAADPHPAPEAPAEAAADESHPVETVTEAGGHVEDAAGAAAPAADAHEPASSAGEVPAVEDTPSAAETPVEPVHVSEPAPTSTAEPVAAAAVAGATASRVDAASPIWSDHGDAPDHAPAPVYKPRKEKTSSSGGSGNEFVEILKTVVFALLIAVVLRIVLFQPFTIPSASMEPNLYEGDYIVVSKWSYGYSRHAIPLSPPLFEGRIFGKAPERGDIAVFKLPRDIGTGPNKVDYIKRVIGLPGDRVQMIDGTLHINGEPVRDVVLDASEVGETFGARPATQMRETLPNGRTFTVQDFGPGGMLDSTPVFEVPAGHYFMMGDNRDNSVDSRDQSSQGVGLVPEENLIGKAEIILFSWSPGASLLNPISWFSKVRPSRFFTDLD